MSKEILVMVCYRRLVRNSDIFDRALQLDCRSLSLLLTRIGRQLEMVPEI